MATNYNEHPITDARSTTGATDTYNDRMTATEPQSADPYLTDKRWKTWPDWVNLILGVYLLLAPLWTAAAPAGWFVTMGIIVSVVALWGLGTASSAPAEWVQIIAGAIVFLAPWLGGFTAASAAAWTAWIIGAAVVIVSAIALATRPKHVV